MYATLHSSHQAGDKANERMKDRDRKGRNKTLYLQTRWSCKQKTPGNVKKINLPYLIREFGKVAGYKASTPQTIVFVYTAKGQLRAEITEMTFTIAPKGEIHR